MLNVIFLVVSLWINTYYKGTHYFNCISFTSLKLSPLIIVLIFFYLPKLALSLKHTHTHTHCHSPSCILRETKKPQYVVLGIVKVELIDHKVVAWVMRCERWGCLLSSIPNSCDTIAIVQWFDIATDTVFYNLGFLYLLADWRNLLVVGGGSSAKVGLATWTI